MPAQLTACRSAQLSLCLALVNACQKPHNTYSSILLLHQPQAPVKAFKAHGFAPKSVAVCTVHERPDSTVPRPHAQYTQLASGCRSSTCESSLSRCRSRALRTHRSRRHRRSRGRTVHIARAARAAPAARLGGPTPAAPSCRHHAPGAAAEGAPTTQQNRP